MKVKILIQGKEAFQYLPRNLTWSVPGLTQDTDGQFIGLYALPWKRYGGGKHEIRFNLGGAPLAWITRSRVGKTTGQRRVSCDWPSRSCSLIDTSKSRSKSDQDIIDLIDQIHEETGTLSSKHRLEDVSSVIQVILINQKVKDSL